MNNYIKNKEEIACMRRVGKMAAQTLEMIGQYVIEGVSTNELNDRCHDYITKTLHAIPAPLNYKGFPKSICTSINEEVCHGIPSEKKLANGDIVNLDVTVIFEGFHGDTSKMFTVGTPTKKSKKLIEDTYKALWLGIKKAKHGARIGDIGDVISRYAASQGLSVVQEYCGHGIGRKFHEYPNVLHFGNAGEGEMLYEGMTITIEPMLNIGKRNVMVLEDDWTVVTKDGTLSAQWEHTILITKSKAEVLTLRNDECLN
ncbi:MAG: type I methionyl aminopeptidase [Methylacidiphilales bacterium]|nr:type I methionyl aminopeptidase [Candidatus Methylacidiphilales bacterium]